MSDEIRDEARRQLAEIDFDLANDEAEVERQMPDVLKRMINESEIARKHYEYVAKEAITPRYRKLYEEQAESYRIRGERLQKIKL